METPFELRAKHLNADADVDSVVAIVNPTRAARIKRFIIASMIYANACRRERQLAFNDARVTCSAKTGIRIEVLVDLLINAISELVRKPPFFE